ncbi:uncharacterized protein LOC125239174 [Leguminivora glycinivorella]|uniref:uncharacterized protein LOC125239174 n=1 Tax=Leguminivora glycinivorella TaxID=1035111 RepID=UPI00200C7FF6|nr:uncharacterized protein LOC125239174 [Leguminivora glycinivorella]
MDIRLSKSSNEGGLRCRACLSVNGKMYNIHEHKLADAFASIIGDCVLKDKLPQHLCVYCGTRLLQSASFRDMCLQTQEYLVTELLGNYSETGGVVSPCLSKRPFNLTTSDVTHTEFTDTHPTEILTGRFIKDEPDINIVDISSIQQADLKTEFEEDKTKTKRKRKTGTTAKKKKSSR